MSQRTQINLRVDESFLEAIGKLQRLDTESVRPPSMSEAIRKAVIEAVERREKAAERRK